MNLIDQYRRAYEREKEAIEWADDMREALKQDPSCELLIDYTRLDVGMKTGTHRIPAHLAGVMIQALKPELERLMQEGLNTLARETEQASNQLKQYVQNLPRP